MTRFAVALLGATLLTPAAMAQTTSAPSSTAQAGATAQASTPTVGATVYDSAGAVLGTIEQITPQAIVVNIGTAKVGLPPNAIGAGPQGLRVALTKEAIQAQAQGAAQQQLASQLVAGSTVYGSGGATVGTIKSVEGEYVTVTTPNGDAKLPRSGFAAGANGPVVGATAAQISAAIRAAGGSSASAAGTTGAAATGDAAAGATTDPTTTGTSASTSAGASATGKTAKTKKSARQR